MFKLKPLPSLPLSLPTETLGEIFSLLLIASRMANEPLWSNLRSASQVCSRWRKAAFQFPRLWSNAIDFETDPLEWTLEMIARSRNCSLRVDIDFSRLCLKANLEPEPRVLKRASQNLKLALENLHRVRSLSVLNMGQSELDEIAIHMQSSAPNIEALTLSAITTSYDTQENSSRAPGIFLLNLNAPLLRSLTAHNCRLSWKSNNLHHLTTLEISETTAHPVLRPTPTELHRIFQDNPLLERLSLCGVLPSPLTSSIGMRLSRLSWLRLDGHANEITPFLISLRVPSTAQISIRCQASPSLEDQIDMLAKCATFPVMDTVMFMSSMFDFRVYGWTTSVSNCFDRFRPQPSWHLQIWWHADLDRRVSVERIVSHICQAPSFQSVRRLVMAIPAKVNFRYHSWASILANMQEISSIQIIGGPPDNLFTYLYENRVACTLPLLRRIELQSSNFDIHLELIQLFSEERHIMIVHLD